MHPKNHYLKITNALLISIIIIYWLSQRRESNIQRTTAKHHTIPFSLKRFTRQRSQAVMTQVLYRTTQIKYECQYFIALIVENYKTLPRVFPRSPYNLPYNSLNWRSSKSDNIARQFLPTTSKYKERLATIINVLEPHQQKVAENIHNKCISESIRMNKMVKHFVTTQILQWYQLVNEWNKPVLEAEAEQPYHYRENIDEQKLAHLTLRHNARMISLKIQKLYQLQERELETLPMSTICINYYQDPAYNALFDFINLNRFQRNQGLRQRMHVHLAAVKNALKSNLERSLMALNESIFIEKGHYYHVLHPDNQYILVVDESNWRGLIKTIESMWDDILSPIKQRWVLWDWLMLVFDYICHFLTYFKRLCVSYSR